MGWERIAPRGLVLLAGIASATCGGGAAASDPLARTVLALDRGIDALTDSSADFRAVLHATVSGLPPGAGADVAAAIRRFLDRAPTPGADFRCGEEFVRLRARQELIRLEDKVLGTGAEATVPQFCYATPYAVDPAMAPKTVEFYGFDFDLVPMQMVLVTTDGYRDASAGLTRRSHYHLTLRLGEGGVTLPRNGRLLALTWGDLIHHAVPIVNAATPLCSCTVEEIPAGKTVAYAPPPLRRVIPPSARAEAGPAWASALLEYEMNGLSATVCMTVAGSGGDRPSRSGCSRVFLLTIDADRTIEGLLGPLQSRATAGRSPSETDPLGRWRFAGFDGDSAGPRVSLELGKLRLVSIAGDGCLSPIAYLEARRTGALSPATVRTMDPKLARLDPAILALRPRFAPPAPAPATGR
jgi:hypothetical protein